MNMNRRSLFGFLAAIPLLPLAAKATAAPRYFTDARNIRVVRAYAHIPASVMRESVWGKDAQRLLNYYVSTQQQMTTNAPKPRLRPTDG